MGKIWDRNPSKLEVIDRCGADEKNNEWPPEPTKFECKQNQTTPTVLVTNMKPKSIT